MMAFYLLFIAISGVITSVNSVYTEFDFNYTSGNCTVKECTDCCYSGCTDTTPITSALAQQYISNVEGDCMNIVSCAVSDWVWPKAYYPDIASSSGCRCPVCSCDVTDEIEYVKKVDTSVVYCYACECNELASYYYSDPSNPNAILRGKECSTVTSDWFVSDPSTIPCPPPICTYNGETHYEGDSWWDDTDPFKFCVCQSDSTELCSATYADIASTPSLLSAFLDSCGSDFRGACATDASLWFDPQDYGNCPRCACDTEGEPGYFTETDEYGKDCYECDCILYSNANKTGYDCGYSSIYDLSDTELETQSWLCPPAECTYNAVTYWEGERWWDSSSNDATCQTFCTCTSDGTALCSATYADITASDALLSAFDASCYGMADSCKTDATRWSNDGSSYCSCPQCDCPADLANPLTDTWFESWIDEDELGTDDLGSIIFDSGGDAYKCDICSCVAGETTCENAVEAEYDISAYCNDASLTQCWEGEIPSNDFATSFSTLTTEYCEPPNDYCTIKHEGTTFTADDDTEYGCNSPFLCDVLGLADAGCVVTTYSSSMYYWNYAADGVSCELIKIAASDHTEYTSCCSGDDCNDYELNPDQCDSTNSVYNEYAQKVYECTWGSQAYMRSIGAILWAFVGAFGGDVCQIDENSIGFAQEPCDFARDFITTGYLCPCSAYSTLYNSPDASTETQARIATFMDDLSAGQFEGMNTEHGCGLQYSCDVDTGDATIVDEDYQLVFDYEGVNCLDDTVYSCATANEYVDDLYDANNVSAALDAITITNCNYNSASATLTMTVTTVFGGTVMKDLVIDGINNDLVIWSDDPLCTVTVTNIQTTTSSTTEQFNGPNNEPMSTSVPTIPSSTASTTGSTSSTASTASTASTSSTASSSGDDDDDYQQGSSASVNKVSYVFLFFFLFAF